MSGRRMPASGKGRAKKMSGALSAIEIISKHFQQLTPESLKKHKIKWLIPNFIRQESLVMIYGAAGSGKSIFTLNLMKHILTKHKKLQVAYIDADNSKSTVISRGLSSLCSDERLHYFNGDGEKARGVFDDLNKSRSLKNTLIVIDSLRNFANFDFSKDDKVTYFLNKLQRLRNKGATIIFLHHQPKQNIGENNKAYKGASAFMDGVDEGYYLSNNKHTFSNKKLNPGEIFFTLEPQKCRDNTLAQAIILNTKTHEMRWTQSMLIGKDSKEQITIYLAGQIIASKKSITQSDLAKEIQKVAAINYYEIVGRNALWRLLSEYDGLLYNIKRANRKNGFGINCVYEIKADLDYRTLF